MSLQHAVLAVALFAPSIRPQVSPIIDLDYAQYQRTVNSWKNLTIILGILCAAAPVVIKVVFQGTQQPQNVTDVRKAIAEPSAYGYFQAGTGTSPMNPRDIIVGTSEDCLFFSAYCPSGVPEGLPPTYVFPIHAKLHALKVKGEALLLIGNAFEGTTLVNHSTGAMTLKVMQYPLDLSPNFGPAQAAKVASLYGA
ncbi:hypothetical protein DFH07DRAFT_987135 [Mycena maculata]|uniref:Uncharacterized protein n=1 Tax=Mycena maculata TaxID=230809 RepID=A0AAD7MWV2_9AGAR|nr:hypothetical protein DFH07DRAFT_987135 [Mycena maculata]